VVLKKLLEHFPSKNTSIIRVQSTFFFLAFNSIATILTISLAILELSEKIACALA